MTRLTEWFAPYWETFTCKVQCLLTGHVYEGCGVHKPSHVQCVRCGRNLR